jgi:hypothetical protein
MAEERRGKSVLELPISNVGTEERKISAGTSNLHK